MEIYVVRHTTPNVAKGVCYGHSDVAVTDDFASEAKRILERIPRTAKIIYTSPLSRCKMLADFLAQYAKLTVVEDIRLKELNFGDWEMRRWDDVDQTRLMQWMRDYETERCPNGESYTDLVMRVKDFIENITVQDEPVIVITHAGVVKSFHAIINQVSLHEAMDLKIGYGEIIRMNSQSSSGWDNRHLTRNSI